MIWINKITVQIVVLTISFQYRFTQSFSEGIKNHQQSTILIILWKVIKITGYKEGGKCSPSTIMIDTS